MVLDEEDMSAKKTIPCLATLSKKVKMLLQTKCQKTDNFMKKTKTTFKKTLMILRNYIEIWACGYFLPKSRYHSIYFRKLF